MTLNAFVLLLISHVLGDVIFTSHRLAVLKRASGSFSQVLGLGCHSGIHALFAGLLLFVSGRLWFRAAIFVFALHFIIDFIRCRLEIRLFRPNTPYVKRSELFAWISGKNRDDDKMSISRLRPWFLINLLDQCIHLGSLYAISTVL